MAPDAFRFEADFLGQRVVEALGDDALVGGRHGRVEPDENVAGLHLVAFLDEDLGDRSAGLVLHLLDVAADHQRPAADHGAGKVDHCREAADAEDECRHRDQADGDDGGRCRRGYGPVRSRAPACSGEGRAFMSLMTLPPLHGLFAAGPDACACRLHDLRAGLDRRDDVRPEHLAQHFFLLAEGGDAAVDHGERHVDAFERARPVRDDDGDAAAPAHRQDRLGQRRVALGVEVGVGLVEDDEERVAIERAGERDALALAGGERGAALADLRSNSRRAGGG